MSNHAHHALAEATDFEGNKEYMTVLDALALEVAAGRPLPPLSEHDIDACCIEFKERESVLDEMLKAHSQLEAALIELAKAQGSIPDQASQSRRISGRHSVITVTLAFTRTLKQTAVERLREYMDAHNCGLFFPRMFSETKKYQQVDGVGDALLGVDLPERTREKVQALFGLCFDVKDAKPRLKVEAIKPVKPSRKPRGGKAAA